MPDGATTLIDPPLLFTAWQDVAVAAKGNCQLRVPRRRHTPRAAGLALVVPDLLPLRGHQGDGKTHALRAAAAPDSVDEVLDVVRKRHLDDEGKACDVNAARSHVGADEESDVALFEGVEVPLALLLLARAGQDHAGVRILLAALELAPVALGPVQSVEVSLQVVAVNVCSAEDQALRHVESICNFDNHLGFHLLDALGHPQSLGLVLVKLGQAGLCVHTVQDGLLLWELCTGGEILV
mmetsp:Transcript_58227/g.180666  ORF Transcript_58227/g.180666 Transcript_58227/m.180666 type:complete len:238 (-) Transcript_58227:753-1466(-)